MGSLKNSSVTVSEQDLSPAAGSKNPGGGIMPVNTGSYINPLKI